MIDIKWEAVEQLPPAPIEQHSLVYSIIHRDRVLWVGERLSNGDYAYLVVSPGYHACDRGRCAYGELSPKTWAPFVSAELVMRR